MDIFISYRRDGGESWAPLIKSELKKKGVKAYLDKTDMRNGDFPESLKANIRNAPNFLLILSKGVWQKRGDNETDWVREEIIYATNQNKNIICIMVNGYDTKVDLSNEKEEISKISTYDILTYNDSNSDLREASIKSIIRRMKDENNKPWKATVKSNDWYSIHNITDEDRLWMISNYEVSRKMDYRLISKMIKEDCFKGRKNLNYFCLDLYDIEQIKKRTLLKSEDSPFNIEAYGFCHDYELEGCEETFGENHFISGCLEENIKEKMEELLTINNIKYFDIMDCTLVLKDLKNPLSALKLLSTFLNPKGGAIFFKELDDDYVDGYPDEKGIVKTMVELLSLDPGAGNRHLGKQMYSLLLKSGADKVYLSDEIVSNANITSKQSKKILDAYFSYLVPEFKLLVHDHPENDEYRSGLEWLENYYDDAEELFSSKEFYFRAGFISGYGIYIDESYLDDELED